MERWEGDYRQTVVRVLRDLLWRYLISEDLYGFFGCGNLEKYVNCVGFLLSLLFYVNDLLVDFSVVCYIFM